MNKKIKLTYISADFFFDVDFPLLKKLSKYYSVEWIAILPSKNPRFSRNHLLKFCKNHNINLTLLKRKHTKSNPLSVFFAVNILHKIYLSKSNLNYLEDIGDIYFALLSIFFLKKSKTTIAFHDVTPHSKSKGYVIQKFHFNLFKYFFKNFHFFSNVQLAKANISKQKNAFVAPLMLKDYGSSKLLKSEKVINFLFFGRIEYYKGLDLMIKAFNSIDSKTLSNCRITIAGNTNNWSYYYDLIEDKSIYDFKIKFIKNDEVANLFSQSHFLILPYRDVTQCGPLFIAMKYNLPVISPDLDGFIEMVDNNQTGVLYDHKKEKALSNTLTKLINNPNFTIDYETMCNNLRLYVKDNFVDTKIINLYLKHLNK